MVQLHFLEIIMMRHFYFETFEAVKAVNAVKAFRDRP